MSKTMVRVFITKCQHQAAVLEAVRAIVKMYAPLYTINRKCASGDVDYRVVVPISVVASHSLLSALSNAGVEATAFSVGEA